MGSLHTSAAFAAAPSTCAMRPRRAVRVCCAQQVVERKQSILEGAKLLATGLAAAALVAAAPAAEAKVILVQPEGVKNFVNSAPAASKASSSAKAASAPSTKYQAPPPTGDEPFDFKPLVLPLTIVGLAGGAAALTALDPGFSEMMVEGGTKDSTSYAGYEPVLKVTPFFGGEGAIPTSVPGGANSGNKKAATVKKAVKKGGPFSFPGKK